MISTHDTMIYTPHDQRHSQGAFQQWRQWTNSIFLLSLTTLLKQTIYCHCFYYHHEARRLQGITRTRPWNTMTEGHGDAIMEEHKVTMEHDDRRASEAVWNLVAGARDALGNFLSHSTNFYWLWNRLMLMPKLMVQLSLPWHIHFCILYVVRKFSDNFMIR